MGARPYDFIFGSPIWVWVGAAIVTVTALLMFFFIFWDIVRPKAIKSVTVGNSTIELWERERKMPGTAEAIIVPVAPDLKMSTGIAKWVRDATAGAVQYEAQKVAPLPPGDAFVGSGGRYRFAVAALAVVMDDTKRTSPEWITQAIAQALVMIRGRDAATCLLPDMTEDLLRQPQWISDDQRRETCRPIARAMINGVLAGAEDMEVKIWVWRGNRDIWEEEFARLEVETSNGHAHALPA
jgi:hypothetical protein